eukprot:TRINITY_DN5257_c0_g1_i1.p1 TRINITY_DN5257_c0_g1~~TRINITY_DN5257_c0_g1_i1.p1  ORF type:complete len:259 (-),score=57.07 TRINITY_DN5257_c0_g1_i1:4-780(-)
MNGAKSELRPKGLVKDWNSRSSNSVLKASSQDSRTKIDFTKQEKTSGNLKVQLLEANNLPIADRNGSSDPYVKISLGECKVKSKKKFKTLNPQWDETFRFKVMDSKTEKLLIRVYDYDLFLSDDHLGEVEVGLGDLVMESEKDLWLDLKTKGGKTGKGRIHLKLQALDFGRPISKVSLKNSSKKEIAASPSKEVEPTKSKVKDQYEVAGNVYVMGVFFDSHKEALNKLLDSIETQNYQSTLTGRSKKTMTFEEEKDKE